MGWSTSVARRVLIESDGSGTGLFVYSGPPGSGDLIASIAAEGGTDSDGNAYDRIISVYAQQGSAFPGQITLTNSPSTGAPYVVFVANTHGEYSAANIQEQVSNPNQANEILSLFMVGPSSTNTPDYYAALALVSAPANGTTPYGALQMVNGSSNQNVLEWFHNQITFFEGSYLYTDGLHLLTKLWGNGGVVTVGDELLAVKGVAAAQPGSSPSTPETWHNLSLINSWSVRSGGYAARYRLTADNCVEVVGEISNSSISGTSQIATLPAGYTPTYNQDVPIGWSSTSGPTSSPTLFLSTSGNLTLFNLPSGTTLVQFSARFPLG